MKVHRPILLFGHVDQLMCGLELQSATEVMENHYYVLDDCFPLRQEENAWLMERLKRRWGDRLTVFKNEKNIGIHRSMNRMMFELIPSVASVFEDDIFMWTSPDSIPVNKGWDQAMVNVLSEFPEIQFVGNSSEAIEKTPDVEWQNWSTTHGTRFMVPMNRPAMWHSTAFRWSFVKEIQGFNQPHSHYGHIESDTWAKLKMRSQHCAYLRDFKEDFRLESMHDEIYTEWKLAVAHSYSFSGTFKEYIDGKA